MFLQFSIRFPGLNVTADFPTLISLLSSPAPDSKIASQISHDYYYGPCNVLGLINATLPCDFGYYPDPNQTLCYGSNLITKDQIITIGNTSEYCNGGATLLNLNTVDEIKNLETFLKTGKIFFINYVMSRLL